MRVRTYNLDGSFRHDAELLQDSRAQLWLDGLPILAVNLWGAKVVLTLTGQLVLIAIQDFGTITRYGGLLDQSEGEAYKTT
jgi:hypothetical protein